jgi:G3E family GTPase
MGLFDPTSKSHDVQNWLSLESVLRAERASHGHAHSKNDGYHHDVSRHDEHIRSFALTDRNPISPQALELFLELLTSYHGPRLLRMKGIIMLSDDPQRPVVIHGVQHVLHPPVRLDRWPQGEALTRLVFIVKDIEKSAIEELFRAFTDPITGGASMTDRSLSLS